MVGQTLVAQLLSGAAGGNIAGAIFRSSSLGTLGNSLVGLVGGVVGGLVLTPWGETVGAAATRATGSDMTLMVSSLTCGVVGGLVLTTFIGVLKTLIVASR